MRAALLPALFLLAAVGCRDAEPAPVAPPAPVVTPAPAPTIAPAIETLLRALADPAQCNRLTGCAPGEALRREGGAAGAGLLALCRSSRGDKYWRERAFALLGQAGGAEAEAFLIERLGDPAERLRHSAALALGHARSEAARPTLEALAAAPPDPVLAVAVDYALARLGAAEARARLDATWAPERLSTDLPMRIHVALEAMRWLEARDAAPSLVALLRHGNLFVRRQALALVDDWRLRAAVPALIALMDDPSAGVQSEALALLRRLTGQRHKRSRAQWEAWCRSAPDCELPE